MVPDKFNMVDMEGIDILFRHGEIIPGLYQKLVESITPCRYQCLYNWYFDGVLIPPAYVEMTVNQDTNDVWINGGIFVTSSDRLLVHLPSIETVLGSVVNITDALQRPVEELICYINPVQAGSGDPSPDNVRPISGFSAINVYNEETYDASATPKLTINWQDTAGTIYGGTVTLNEDGSADVVVTHVGTFLSSLEWDSLSTPSSHLFRSDTLKNVIKTQTGLQNLPYAICSVFYPMPYGPISQRDDGAFSVGNFDGRAPGRIVFVDQRFSSVDDFTDGNDSTKFVYELTTPQTYHFSNIGQLYTRLGTNVIWHNANGDVSVTYWKK